jgi:hypothetical protein
MDVEVYATDIQAVVIAGFYSDWSHPSLPQRNNRVGWCRHIAAARHKPQPGDSALAIA